MRHFFTKPHNKNLIVIGPNLDISLSFTREIGEGSTDPEIMKDALNTLGLTFVNLYNNGQTINLWVKSAYSKIRYIDSTLCTYDAVYLVYEPDNFIHVSEADKMKQKCEELNIPVASIAYTASASITNQPSMLQSIAEHFVIEDGDVQLTNIHVTPDYTLIAGQTNAASQLKNRLLENLSSPSSEGRGCTLS